MEHPANEHDVNVDPEPVEDSQPEPELEGQPVEDEVADDNVDEEMSEPTGLPEESFEADPDDLHGAEDQPEDS